MALDLLAEQRANPHRNVQHHTPRHFPAGNDVKHPAPILNTNVNPMSEMFSYTGDHTKFVLVMVGLPARGKSFIARKIRSYLSWLGIDVQWFNIGEYRRYCARDTVGVQSSSFFDPNNKITKKRRELYALIALVELEKYLNGGKGQVAILDGTNTTKYRRRMIRDFFKRKNRPSPDLNVKIVFIESICRDESIIEKNILNVKLRSPDYVNVLPEKAVKDFKERIKHYENMYVPLTEEDGSYIKLIDAGKKVIGHDVNGYLPSRILYFLMHLNLTKVAHFFTRHGESLYNTENRIGGDSPLTESGVKYSRSMADFMSLQPEFKNGTMKVWCSTLKRCTETAKAFNDIEPNIHNGACKKFNVYKWRALCEIEAGICDSMTYKQIEEKYPNEFEERRKNKLTYRYPQGESYKDVIKRLEPVIFELERATQPILVIAHQAVLRCLYGYFMDKSESEIPFLKIDLHTIYKLSPTDYSTEVDKFTFGCSKTIISKHGTQDDNLIPYLSLNEINNTKTQPIARYKDVGSLSASYLPNAVRPKLQQLNNNNHRHTSPHPPHRKKKSRDFTRGRNNDKNNNMSEINGTESRNNSV